MKAFILLPVLLLISLISSLLLTITFVATSSIATHNLSTLSINENQALTKNHIEQLFSGQKNFPLSSIANELWAINVQPLLHIEKIVSHLVPCLQIAGQRIISSSSKSFNSSFDCINPIIDQSFSIQENLVLETLINTNSITLATLGTMTVNNFQARNNINIISLGDISIKNINNEYCISIFSLQGSISISNVTGNGLYELHYKKSLQSGANVVQGVCDHGLEMMEGYVFGMPRVVS